MRNEFISTANTNNFEKMCEELSDPTSLIGPSMAMVTGPAGRGKSEAAKHYVVQTDAIYIPPLNIRTPAMVLREIAFELATVRPNRSDACLTVIGEEMKKSRRLVIVDEADLLPMQILEMLRNVNERYACPILLLGEDELKGKVASRRRIASRIRRKMEFSPVTQPDIAFYLKKALDLKASPDVTAIIHKHSNGDWRPVLTMTIALERAMNASGISEITPEMVKDVIKS